MLKRHISLSLIVFLNLLLIVSFVLSSIYVGSFVNNQINEGQGYNGQGGYTIPSVGYSVFSITVSHPFYENGTIANLGTMPTTIPNYPFYIFLMTVIVNLVLFWLVYKKHS